jgi:murein DD-endopeptidase MepM/ murein hydrolase activator NlpD
VRRKSGTGTIFSVLTLGVTLLAIPLFDGCRESTMAPEECGPFPAWQSSDYVLPYSLGTSYVVHQGNCSGEGHSGFWKYGYDFTMNVGTLVTAARSGRVLHSVGDVFDGDRTRTNLVTVQHEDGTVAVYSHLTHGGALVAVGEHVVAGEPIARSGDTGNTGGFPHLHFSLHPCGDLPGLPAEGSCPSIPVTFRNTSPNTNGLQVRQSYVAEPFE